MRRRLTITAAVALGILTSVGLNGCTNDRGANNPPTTTPAAATSATPPQANPTASPTPPVSPSAAANDNPKRVATRFAKAWLEPNPKRRTAGLRATAIPHLAELLITTDPAKLPEGKPDGDPVRAPLPAGEAPENAARAIRYEQALSDDEFPAIVIDLIPLPERDDGWAVVAVAPKE